ncbi:MAG: PKD domain-containing protein [Pirellulales bacterium]|nr:PKD domain-containing protein [Pirellulales bacterium]
MSGRYSWQSNRSSLRLHKTHQAKVQQDYHRRLRCEPLEDRRMLSITLFVDADAAPSGDGMAWETAFGDLQAALTQAAAFNGDTTPTNDVNSIWIAEGTYKPTAELEPGDARSASFSLLDGVALYGGFTGTETTLAQRNLSAHITTLSGDLGVTGTNSDNAYTVVYCGTNVEATLDGLKITAGNANVSSSSEHPEKAFGGGIFNIGTLMITNSTISSNSASIGGGIYNISQSSLTVTNSTISGNSASWGGGIANNGTSSLTVTNSTISDNSASLGGGIHNSGISSLTVTNSTILGNSTVFYGGGIYNSSFSFLTVTNSTISSNSAQSSGGGIYNWVSTLTVTNSTISGNSVRGNGGGIYVDNRSQTATLNNTIVAKNTSSSTPSAGWDIYDSHGILSGFHCLVGDGLGQNTIVNGADGNIVGTYTSPVDPRFVRNPSNSDYGDLRLLSDSPAIDKGQNDLAIDSEGNPLLTDLDGNPRITNAMVDMGAYEQLNSDPRIISCNVTSVVNENNSATLTLRFGDDNLRDEHTVLIDWADGSTENVTLTVGQRELVIEHPYLDDDPSGTAADQYSVKVIVSDGLAEVQKSATLTVNNVAPLVEPIGGPALQTGVPGQTLAFSTEFSDPGTLDTHEVEWDFGDGTVIAFQLATAEALAPTHVYTSIGTFNVSVTVRDDDLGESTQTTEVTIDRVTLQDDPLYPGEKMLVVGGTDRNDRIEFAPKGNKGDVKVIFNGRQLGTFRPTSRIVAYGLGGNDLIHLAGSIDIAAWLYGGEGNDRLYGGRGDDLLFGESGNDLLLGQQGRDLIVGGTGRDWILDNSGDDILIAGYLELANTDETLRDIMSVWISDEWDYDTRVDMLSGVLMADDTVKNDTDRDFLFGASGNDWFFYELGRDRAIGRRR